MATPGLPVVSGLFLPFLPLPAQLTLEYVALKPHSDLPSHKSPRLPTPPNSHGNVLGFVQYN